MKIDFVLGLDPLPFEETMRWWDSEETVAWFSQKGYLLYKRTTFDDGEISATMYPQHPTLECSDLQDPYPYSYIGDKEIPTYAGHSTKIAYAQDTENRHVVIKIIPVDSDEHKILEFLRQQDPGVMKNACIIPVFDILVFDHRYAFVVMPRWSDRLGRRSIISVGQNLKMIHCMLKALKFLHDHRIVHHDFTTYNLLINYFTCWNTPPDDHEREKLREADRIRYALCDFNVSMKFEENTDLKTCRLPYYKSFVGGVLYMTLPPDVKQGELYYNPFAYDTALLGMELIEQFEAIIPRIPHLAPLFDRMVTYNIPQRFTMMEALDFFEKSCLAKYESQFAECIGDPIETNGLWDGLPPSFIEEWSSHRTPPLPLTKKVLRRVCTYRIGCCAVICIRKLIEKAHK